MKAYNIRIALESNISDARLRKWLGEKYILNVGTLKNVLCCLSVDCHDMKYALIIHDSDYTCNKPHLHLVVFCNKDAIHRLHAHFPVGYFEECRSFDASLLYLLHCGHADKKQYSVSDLFTNIDYYSYFPFLRGVC